MRYALVLILMAGLAQLWFGSPKAAEQTPAEDKSWWEKREQRSDIYYPHNLHMEAMERMGDSCMLCHSFAKNDVLAQDQLKALTTVSNEPLKAICHSCHVDQRTGPWRCKLCHDDKTRIWPDDHNHGYVQHHAEDARRDQGACRECHLDMAYCTDCHFRRDTLGSGYHPLGYRSLHGIEARMKAMECGRCHNADYCADCHERTR